MRRQRRIDSRSAKVRVSEVHKALMMTIVVDMTSSTRANKQSI